MPAVDLLPIVSTFVATGAPTSEFSGAEILMVGNLVTTNSNAGDPRFSLQYIAGDFYTWLRYDISSIPTAATILTASLLVECGWSEAADYNSIAFGVQRCTNITFASTISYNTAPFASNTGAFFIGYMPQSPSSQATVNVKTMVQNAVSGGSGKLSMCVSPSGVGQDFFWMHSSKYTGASYNLPLLSITYSLDNRIITAFFD
jgi:hypothetical protein